MKYAILLLLTLSVSSCSTYDHSKPTYRKTSSALNDFTVYQPLDVKNVFIIEPAYIPNNLASFGKIHFEGNKVIADLSTSIGADPKDKEAFDGRAICDGEEKTSGWHVALLATAQAEKLSFEEMKAFVNENVVNHCKAMGGEIISDNGNEFKVITESKAFRLRQKGVGTFSKLIPEKRNCYSYEALVRCDVTNRKEEILKQVDLIKELRARPMNQ